jgi:uroporphyrinogen III methyltransferase/synthase
LEAGQKDEFTRQLQQLGAQVFDLPAMRVLPPKDRTDLDAAINSMVHGLGWDWIVFSSANAVRCFLDRMIESGADLRLLAGARLGALGEATAGALAEYRLNADFIPARFSGQDWAEQAPQLNGCRVLLPCSGIAGPEFARSLEERGARVERVTAYTVAPAEPDAQILEMVEEGQIDIVAFFSPSALRAIYGMLDGAYGENRARAALEAARIACIGRTTSAAVEEMGLHASIVADEQSAAGLVEAILKWRMP